MATLILTCEKNSGRSQTSAKEIDAVAISRILFMAPKRIESARRCMACRSRNRCRSPMYANRGNRIPRYRGSGARKNFHRISNWVDRLPRRNGVHCSVTYRFAGGTSVTRAQLPHETRRSHSRHWRDALPNPLDTLI